MKISVHLNQESRGAHRAAMIRLPVKSKKTRNPPLISLVIRISVTKVAIRLLTPVFDQYMAE